MLLSLALALAVNHSTTFISHRPPSDEFTVRLNPPASWVEVERILGNRGHIDASSASGFDFTVQIWDSKYDQQVRNKLQSLNGIRILSAKEEDVDLSSIFSVRRKLRHLRAEQIQERPHETGPELGYLGGYERLLSLVTGEDGVADWSTINHARTQAELLPKMRFQSRSQNGKPMGVPSWQFVGPTNLFGPTANSQLFGIGPCSGRVSAVAFDPKTSSTIYATGANGGLWKSTDSGGNWTWLSQKWTQLDTSCISIAPNDPKTILVGMGDYHYSVFASSGFELTTDGGITWNLISTSTKYRGTKKEAKVSIPTVASILVDPTNPKVLIAGTATPKDNLKGDLLRSVDGGKTWDNLVIEGACNYPTVAATLVTKGKVRFYALAAGFPGPAGSFTSRLLYSDDHGKSWIRLTCPLNALNTYHSALNVVTSCTSPDTLYIFSSHEHLFYVSKDAGNTWVNKSSTLPANDFNRDNFYQGGYDYFLACTKRQVPGSNTFTDALYLGLITLSESTDQGDTWTSISGNVYDIGTSVMHGDQHCALFDPKNPNVALVGNDGGVYRVEYNSNSQANKVTSLNKNLGITEFYRVATHPTAPDVVLAGAQDNMSAFMNGDPSSWLSVGGGDGGTSLIHPKVPNYQIASSENLGFTYTTDGWKTLNDISIPTGNADVDYLPFLCPLKQYPFDDNIVGTASNFFWTFDKSTNQWTRMGYTAGLYVAFPTDIEFTQTNLLRVYCAIQENNKTNKGHLMMSIDGGTIFKEVTIPAGIGISSISVNPNNEDDIVLTRYGTSGLVQRCQNILDANPTWQDLTFNLPKTSVTSFLRDPADPDNTWYVTSSAGVFQTADGGDTWNDAGQSFGLPPLVIYDIAANPTTRDFYVATYGRGIWKLKIPVGENKLAQLGAPLQIVGGTTDLGVVMMAAPLGSNSATISLSSTGQITIPPSVNVSAHDYKSTFPIAAKVVTNTAKATITATYANVTKTVNLSIVPPSLSSISTLLNTVSNGDSVYGTVTISGPAPAAGYKVALTSNAKEVQVPSVVTIAGGKTSVVFTVTTSAVAADKAVQLSAKLGAVSKTTVLTVLSTAVKSITLDKPNVVGGSDTVVTGTLTFTGPTVAGGIKVSLQSSDPNAATVPATLTVILLRDNRTATFTVTHIAVATAKSTTISATAGSRSQTVGLAVNPFLVTSITLNPGTVTTGTSVNGRVDLNASPSDKTGNIVVALNADSLAATVPATVSITPHASYGTFGIGTPGSGTVNISATLSGQSSMAALTINGLGLTGLTLTPDTVNVGTGAQVTGTVTLGSPAPAGGAVVYLNSALSSLANVPQSVTIPAGQTSATFQVRYTTLLTAQTTVTITADYGGKQLAATLTLKP